MVHRRLHVNFVPFCVVFVPIVCRGPIFLSLLHRANTQSGYSARPSLMNSQSEVNADSLYLFLMITT